MMPCAEQDFPAGGLLVTKLYHPPLQPHVVERSDLLDRFTLGLARPLTVVSAPAGFGKTTLVSAWRASQGSAYPLAWLSLDSDDNDGARFLHYLTAAIDGAAPGAGVQAAALLRLPAAPDPRAVISALLNGLLSVRQAAPPSLPLALVLDDYHVLTSPAVHQTVTYLIEHLPPALRLVLLTRIDPPLPLARLRVRGQLSEIRAADLRFTAEEASAFLNGAMGLGLAREDIGALEARTEGWVAALQLAAICLGSAAAIDEPRAAGSLMPGTPGAGAARASDERKGTRVARFIEAFGASNRFVAEYLMDEVLSRQPEYVQQFLLRTSILEQLCSPLCDELLWASGGMRSASDEGESAGQVIDYLLRANLFLIPLDDSGYWHRYHHLFRDFLRGRLTAGARGQPSRLAELHLAASNWFETNGYLNEAVRHAVQSGEMGRAADLVERYANPMLCRSEVKALQGWYNLLPEALIRQRPILAVYHAWALNLLPGPGSHELIERRLAEAEGAAAGAAAGAPEDVRRTVSGHAATIRVYAIDHAARSAADYRAMLDLAQTAEQLLPESELTVHGVNQYNMGRAYMGLGDLLKADEAFEESRRVGVRVGNEYVAASSLYYRARILHLRGKLGEAEAMLRQVIAGEAWLPPRDLVRLPALGASYVALGCVELERYELEAAEAHLSRGLDALQYAFVHGAVEAGHAALAQVRQMGGAGDANEVVERLARVQPVGPLNAAAVRAQLQFQASPTQPSAAALTWAREAGKDPEVMARGFGANAWGDARYLAFVTAARLRLTGGDAAALVEPLETRIAELESAGMRLRAAELSTVLALAHHALGENRRAFNSLRGALEAAEPEGLLRTFDGGPALAKLLSEAAGRGIAPGYVARVLAQLGAGQGQPSVAEPFKGVGPAGASGAAESLAPEPVAQQVSAGPMGPLEKLTEREQEILDLIAQGMSNADIAARLYVEVSTVKRHINHILDKLEAGNRVQAVVRARALGLLK